MIRRGNFSRTLFAAALVACVANAAAAQPRAARTRRPAALIGNIKGAVDDSSCGCGFSFSRRDQRARRYVFFEDFAAEPPVMNVGGRDVRLALVRTTEPEGGVSRRGARFTRWYAAGRVRVRMDFVATNVCNPDDGCESNHFNVRINARGGARSQTVNTVGGCGC